MKLLKINSLKFLLLFLTTNFIHFDISYSKNLKISGLNKLNFNDIQTISDINIFLTIYQIMIFQF